MKQAADSYAKMIETPISRLVGTLAVPTVISMLISNVYNLADSFFVGKISTSASGAIGIVLSVQAIIQAFGFLCGQGAGSIISRELGARNTASASKFASTGFFLSILFGVLLAVPGLLFLDPLMRLMGSTETILPYATSYGRYILLAAPFLASSCVMNNIMRYEGRAALATIGLSTGSILNIALDPIFMFRLGMGIDGAGLATAASQVVSFFLLLSMFLSGKTQTRLSFRHITRRLSDVAAILRTGMPSLLRQGLSSVSNMLLNNSAAIFGDAAVAAMSIVGRVCMFIASIMIGIGQGLQPVAGFNFGAKKYSRVKGAFRFTLKTGELLLASFALIGFLFPAAIIQTFRNDPAVVAIGVPALRFQCIALLFQPLTVCSTMTFQSIGESRKASFVSTLRSGLYFIPLVWLLPRFIGIAGLQCAQAVSDILAFFTVLPFIVAYLKKMPDDIAS